MTQHYYALILAGGGGTRLWPMSRGEQPKQLLKLTGDDTMFKVSVDRLRPMFAPEHIFIATEQPYVDALKAEAPDIPAENFVVEPSARNTAAAVGLALTVIQQRDEQAVVAMLTADHHIGKPGVFRDVLQTAYEIAADDKIVTLGISPTFPSTGFGYIQQGDSLGISNGFPYHVAERFTEKPDLVKATQFVASGRYSWNSGMFIWRASKAMREFQTQQPDMHALLQNLAPTVGTEDYGPTLDHIWEQMPKISIDYAIMEGANEMVVIPVDIGWSDVGTWSSLYELLDRDKLGNCSKNGSEKRIVLDTRNSLLFTDKLAVAIGVEDIIIVDADDALLVCHKDRAQDVKEIVQFLRSNDMDSYL